MYRVTETLSFRARASRRFTGEGRGVAGGIAGRADAFLLN